VSESQFRAILAVLISGILITWPAISVCEFSLFLRSYILDVFIKQHSKLGLVQYLANVFDPPLYLVVTSQEYFAILTLNRNTAATSSHCQPTNYSAEWVRVILRRFLRLYLRTTASCLFCSSSSLLWQHVCMIRLLDFSPVLYGLILFALADLCSSVSCHDLAEIHLLLLDSILFSCQVRHQHSPWQLEWIDSTVSVGRVHPAAVEICLFLLFIYLL